MIFLIEKCLEHCKQAVVDKMEIVCTKLKISVIPMMY